MTTHRMQLQTTPFEKIKNGTKTIEIRLNDEKRQQIKVGDKVEFWLATDADQTVMTEVVELKAFPSLKELFAAYPPSEYGGESADEWERMYQFYSKEDEEKYGALAIQIRPVVV